jgi:hypothetical protein
MSVLARFGMDSTRSLVLLKGRADAGEAIKKQE